MLNVIVGHLVDVSEETKLWDTICLGIPLLGIYLQLQTTPTLKTCSWIFEKSINICKIKKTNVYLLLDG